MVFPVPGFPAISTVDPLGIPPSINPSSPEIPVEIRSTVIELLTRILKVIVPKLHF
jgi:hypothetical protein